MYWILRGRTYRTPKQTSSRENLATVKLKPEDVVEIRGHLKLGRPTEWCALKYGVTNSTIQRIKYNLSWKDVRAKRAS